MKSPWRPSTRTERGVVLKAVDREHWMTLTEMSVPSKASTVTAAALTGAHILSEVLGLIIGQHVNEEMLTTCIEQRTDAMTKAK